MALLLPDVCLVKFWLLKIKFFVQQSYLPFIRDKNSRLTLCLHLIDPSLKILTEVNERRKLFFNWPRSLMHEAQQDTTGTSEAISPASRRRLTRKLRVGERWRRVRGGWRGGRGREPGTKILWLLESSGFSFCPHVALPKAWGLKERTWVKGQNWIHPYNTVVCI